MLLFSFFTFKMIESKCKDRYFSATMQERDYKIE